MDLHDIREDYCKQALSQHDCDPNPIKQFEKWLNEAITAKVNEPTGVNVATVNEDGRPTSRMVLLKEVNEIETLDTIKEEIYARKKELENR